MALKGRWTKQDVEALRASQMRTLRKNAVRARDDQVVSWCDEVLQALPQPPKDAVALDSEAKKLP
jgi:hypothetical protein